MPLCCHTPLQVWAPPWGALDLCGPSLGLGTLALGLAPFSLPWLPSAPHHTHHPTAFLERPLPWTACLAEALSHKWVFLRRGLSRAGIAAVAYAR